MTWLFPTPGYNSDPTLDPWMIITYWLLPILMISAKHCTKKSTKKESSRTKSEASIAVHYTFILINGNLLSKPLLHTSRKSSLEQCLFSMWTVSYVWQSPLNEDPKWSSRPHITRCSAHASPSGTNIIKVSCSVITIGFYLRSRCHMPHDPVRWMIADILHERV